MEMNRTPQMAFLTALTLLYVVGGMMSTARAEQPNIILILVDDLGWMDLACQGNRLVETPHIDQLARDGIRFTNAYAAAPVCSPTRAAIVTGKSPARLKITNHIPDQPRFTPDNATLAPAAMTDRLPLEEITLAERLLAADYATGFFGKWHLAGRGDAAFYPDHQGFQVNLGGCALGGPPTFFDPYRIPTLPNRRQGEYLPDRLVDETIDFIESRKDRPFFVSLWMYTVHWPMEAPDSLLEKYADRTGPGLNDTRYGAMIEAMDVALGRLFAAIQAQDLAGDTLIIFTSDNGGFGGVADNRPLRAEKGHLYEGGIRVPWIVRWPNVIEGGRTSDAPIISMDLYPTILSAAGVQPTPDEAPDGIDLMPLLRDSSALDRDAIYFHYPNYAFHRSNRLGSAIRSGRYKLIEFFDDDSVELYDLSTDISETNNLAGKLPDLANRLHEKLKQWRLDVNASMPTPIQPAPLP
jgi:arylsulfatase A